MAIGPFSMTEERLFNCLRLIRSPGIGPSTYFEGVRQFGSEKEVLKALTQKGYSLISPRRVEEEVRQSEKLGVRFFTYYDPEYPPLLKEISDFPPVLSIMGRTELLSQSCVAIVGARAASINGRAFATKLAEELGQEGYVVVSGLARGIDGAAHRGALATGTIAVVAGGVDVLYPPEHHKLRAEIMEKGVLMSEMPLTLFPGAKHFPRRNRLISGLSKAVCVVEAGRPSGSLITAGYALDQGRELFAVPGFPGDQKSVGSNHLLKNGANVLEGVEDIVNVCGRGDLSLLPSGMIRESLRSPDLRFASPEDDKEGYLEKRILNHLSAQPVSIESLAQVLEEHLNTLNAVLLDLELAGKVDCDQAGNVSLRV